MPAPCRHDPPRATAGPRKPGTCYLCWLSLNHAAYGPAWTGTVPATPIPAGKRVALCVHLGSRVPRSSAKDWRTCGKGRGTVCPCGACQTCPEYQPEE